MIYRNSTPSDLPAIVALLESANLILDGVEEIADRFLLAFRDETLIGCAALEPFDKTALLRSVAVSETVRGAGLGQEIVRRLLDQARDNGFENVVLLTSTAERFFPRFGFRRIARDDAPPSVQSSIEFRSACPQSATVMMLDLKGE
ncbi:MAG: arsenic resistance N-acetyltransferase ArsN2 [Acidobacteriota bacterium]